MQRKAPAPPPLGAAARGCVIDLLVRPPMSRTVAHTHSLSLFLSCCCKPHWRYPGLETSKRERLWDWDGTRRVWVHSVRHSQRQLRRRRCLEALHLLFTFTYSDYPYILPIVSVDYMCVVVCVLLVTRFVRYRRVLLAVTQRGEKLSAPGGAFSR